MNRAKLTVVALGLLCLGNYANAQQTAGNSYVETSTSISKMAINGTLQFWYANNNGAVPKDAFYLRRAMIRLSGAVRPEVSWEVMFDPATVREDDTKSSGAYITSVGRKSPFQHFTLTLKHKSYSANFGQYRVPFAMEGLEMPYKRDFIEMSMLFSRLKWAEYRDIGVTVKGDFKVGDIAVQPQFGLFNGAGQNRLETNKPFDFAYRMVVKPTDRLHLGAAHYYGKTGISGTVDNFRTGLEAKFTGQPFSAHSEYVTGKSEGKKIKTYYADAEYKFLASVQAVVRYDFYDPDAKTKNDGETETTLGLDYFLNGYNSKISVNYVFSGEEGTDVSDDIIRAQVTVTF